MFNSFDEIQIRIILTIKTPLMYIYKRASLACAAQVTNTVSAGGALRRLGS